MSEVAQSKRAGKYNAKGQHINKTTLEVTHGKDPDRVWFASGAEAERYLQLRALEASGQIRQLRTQRSFPLHWNGVKLGVYRADFEYVVTAARVHDEYVCVEDVKGMVTDVFDIKKKLLLAQYKIEVIEIPAKQVKKWHNTIPPPPRGG